ncbi:MAG: prolipoprotein diacylglyceryl transferase [Chloroflexi bacterium]|nr:prolipoprotein diacylglyceryl transferase [Chloroflexota bacterium]
MVITIGLDPIIFRVGSFTVAWHGVFTAVAVFVGVYVAARLARRVALVPEVVYSVALWAVPGGVVGARLFHVIDYWSFYAANPVQILAINEGGLAIWGAVIGGTVAGILYAWLRRLPVGRLMDLASLGIILAQATGRIGDIINGEHFARESGLPWAVVYTHPNSPSFGRAPQHPAVAYELVMDLAIFGVLWVLWRRLRPDGALMLVYFSLYALGRFLVSFLREEKVVLLGMQQAQVVSLLILAVTLPTLGYLMQRERRRLRAAGGPGAGDAPQAVG